ncbi:MAG: phage portal protein [Clostridium sp.]|jgi:SPP1 family phage portal protein|nr:phage portal protein [Clostridium sp.]
MASFGRRKILLDVGRVHEGNVLDVLKRALEVHRLNSKECQHLIDYYKGKQGILDRTKAVREEINNKILINHANEIVSFKVSYLLSEPIAYVTRGGGNAAEKVNALNEMMYLNNKAARDKEIADDFTICGQAYRMVLPNKAEGDDEPPFKVYTLDPQCTFVVYNSGLGEEPICAVKYVSIPDMFGDSAKEPTFDTVYSIYTPDMYFEVKNDILQTEKTKHHSLGMVPIFEYMNNNARLGAFEVVETILDAINTLASNRVDATEQVVQALMVFVNCEIDSDQYDEMRKKGAVKIKSVDGATSDIKLLTADFKQADQQVLTDALYNIMLKITGMPTQASETSSDSSNNGAMIVKNGWFHAEARAKDTELLWREAEGNFLKLVLKICRETGDLDIKLSEFTPKFSRKNYEDVQTKSQVLTAMLATDKIAPRLAFAHCGLFVDSESAYSESKEWYEASMVREEEKLPDETILVEDEQT